MRKPETSQNSSPFGAERPQRVKEVCKNGHDVAEVGRTTSGRCRQCNRDANQRRYTERRGIYKVRAERYEAALAMNMGDEACAICGRTQSTQWDSKRLHVDHDHITGRIRGLLCNLCNTSLGGFQDNPALLMSAISYLKERGEDYGN